MAQKNFKIDPDVKVGIKYIWEDTIYRVIFDGSFEHIPRVFLTVNDDILRPCHLQAENFVLVDGRCTEFYIRVIKTQGGPAVQRWVAWMAMDYKSG